MSGFVGQVGWDGTTLPAEMLGQAAIHVANRGQDDVLKHSDDRFAVAVRPFRAEGHPGLVVERSGRFVGAFDGPIEGLGDDTGASRFLAALASDPRETLRNAVGDFALALWNGADQTLLLARDHLGAKPLFFAATDGGVLFASSPAAIIACGWPAAVDEEAIAVLLSLGLMPAPWTGWKGIDSVRPGEVVHFSRSDTRCEKYTEAYLPVMSSSAETEVVAAVRSTLESALGELVAAEGQTTVALSGGVDSTGVAGLVQRIAGRRVDTICLGFEDAANEDVRYAQLAAAELGTRHHEVIVTPGEVADGFSEISRCLVVPSALSYAEFFLTRSVTDGGAETLITGEVADSLYGGTSPFFWTDRLRKYRRAPRVLRRAFARVAAQLPEKGVAARVRRASRDIDRLDRMEPARQYLSFRELFTPTEINALLPACQGSGDTVLEYLRGVVGPTPEDPRDWAFRATMGHETPSEYLRDDFKMSRPLLYRSPFTHQHVVRQAMSLSADWKVNRNGQKYVLRRALAEFIPAAIAERPKRGFVAPLQVWLKGPLRDLLAEYLSPQRIPPFLDEQEVIKIGQRFLDGNDSDAFRKAWMMMTISAWHRTHIAGDRRPGSDGRRY